MRTGAPRSLKARALQWLAQREQSRSELRVKLLRAAAADVRNQRASAAAAAAAVQPEALGGPDVMPIAGHDEEPDTRSTATRIDALLDWLEADGFLSAERFVESRVHARSARFGNLRIRLELKQHQLHLPDNLARALNDSELTRACALRARKFSSWPSCAAERAKQARFLAGRGFATDTIARALRAPVEDRMSDDSDD